ncbi:hypothetical protein A2U01_0078855, partial [Trifolium medium]|nr:hypothetical protein [Trifolium medium]
MFKRKRTKQADPDQAQPEPGGMDTEADTGNPISLNDNIANFQAQTHFTSSPLNQPINVIHPPLTSDLPSITSETDLDTVAEGI